MRSDITFYSHPELPFLELKVCESLGVSYKKHFHEEWSLGLIEEGDSVIWCDGQEVSLGREDLLLIPAHMPHCCNPRPHEVWRYQMLFVQPQWIAGLGVEDSSMQFKHLSGESSHLPARLMRQLAHELRRGSTALALEITAVRLFRRLFVGEEHDREEAAAVRAADSRHSQSIRAYLEECYLQKVTLDDLQQLTGLSKFRLIHLFKRDHHVPPHLYQNLLRINYAKRELRRRRPIAEVALEAGFYDQSHFTRLFKQCVGVTPSQYV
ncbi:helix-turn-helix transcriptional regulator [Paenibacillus sp. SYP-B4298]|uniref:helix-turn-helix transcriptional regulator n=1 Tax=Paenibacillus sp. SYP-B4298 TaxID=2996034 RepID=UPI0022DCF713|nr:AraC family transcriptional regulator [Paenibacillus sp. SYP-B4298]